jgi:hypothetical protein
MGLHVTISTLESVTSLLTVYNEINPSADPIKLPASETYFVTSGSGKPRQTAGDRARTRVKIGSDRGGCFLNAPASTVSHFVSKLDNTGLPLKP